MLGWLESWWRKDLEVSQVGALDSAARVVPEHNSHEDDGEESLDVWGFRDTQFQAGKGSSLFEALASRSLTDYLNSQIRTE
jgi:hypothetical protein